MISSSKQIGKQIGDLDGKGKGRGGRLLQYFYSVDVARVFGIDLWKVSPTFTYHQVKNELKRLQRQKTSRGNEETIHKTS